MQTVKTKQQAHAAVQRWRREGQIVAFVPTMGNLHDGHLKLVESARQHADRVVVSIFVNPMQFGANEDIDNYPRTMERDSACLAESNADLLFAPDKAEVYPQSEGPQTRVEIPELSFILCGESRPTHFVGVTTVVAKLFNIVQPDIAVFGEKDYQQLFLIRKMVNELDFPIKIIGVPTEREDDGLAMSSRNAYMSDGERQQATELNKTLLEIEFLLKKGDKEFKSLEENAAKILENHGFSVDYVSIRRQQDLLPASAGDRELVILAAAWMGKARLIDNISVNI